MRVAACAAVVGILTRGTEPTIATEEVEAGLDLGHPAHDAFDAKPSATFLAHPCVGYRASDLEAVPVGNVFLVAEQICR